jgi:NAD(P)-dependent dehydrogenase (short-subunit alcohol dehydrogenase family)
MRPKTALITGCSAGGVGKALARSFHRKGLEVFATARDLSKVADLEVLGLDVIQLDVVDPDSVREAVDVVREATGGSLDILVNNAGIGKIWYLLTETSRSFYLCPEKRKAIYDLFGFVEGLFDLEFLISALRSLTTFFYQHISCPPLTWT